VNSETPWRAGRLGAARGTQRLLFGRMYEDVEIERRAFLNRRRVFCIASAGCTALALAQDHDVVACDINPVQLAYAEERACGAGAIAGDVERAMRLARFFAPSVGWRRQTVEDFLSLSEGDQQVEFWRKNLDTRRFRSALAVLLSPVTLRLVYAPHFLSVLPRHFPAVVRARLERGFVRHPNASNPYIRALFLGEPPPRLATHGPPVRFVLADAASYLESCPAGSFDALTLSNILDGADAAYREKLSRAVRRAATPDAVVVLRSFAPPAADAAANYAEHDRAMLWGTVDIRSALSF